MSVRVLRSGQRARCGITSASPLTRTLMALEVPTATTVATEKVLVRAKEKERVARAREKATSKEKEKEMAKEQPHTARVERDRMGKARPCNKERVEKEKVEKEKAEREKAEKEKAAARASLGRERNGI